MFKRSTSILTRYVTQYARQTQIKDIRRIHRWVAPTLVEINRRKNKLGPQKPDPRNKYLEWNYEAEIFAFGKRLHEEFDKNLLKQAFIHREYANLQEIQAKDQGLEYQKVDNHELIQEGNKIIQNYIKTFYANTYPDAVVQAISQHLMSTETLAHVSKHLGTTHLILTTEYPVEQHSLANTFKAIVACLKRSQDLNRAELFIKDFLLCQMIDKNVFELWNPNNPYEFLTNLLQEKGITEIEPRLCNSSGVNTILSNYQVGLYNNKKLLGIGWGESVDIAKQTAALDAIQRLYT